MGLIFVGMVLVRRTDHERDVCLERFLYRRKKDPKPSVSSHGVARVRMECPCRRFGIHALVDNSGDLVFAQSLVLLLSHSLADMNGRCLAPLPRCLLRLQRHLDYPLRVL